MATLDQPLIGASLSLPWDGRIVFSSTKDLHTFIEVLNRSHCLTSSYSKSAKLAEWNKEGGEWTIEFETLPSSIIAEAKMNTLIDP